MANTIINVSSAAELNAALASASGGETILLAAGSYGALSIGNNYASNVTIASADANNPAAINQLRATGASNITFDSVVFDYQYGGEKTSATPFKVENSSNVTISNSLFLGDVAADGYATGKGLTVRNSSDVVIDNNEFTNFWKGLGASFSTNVTVTNNEVHSLRSDGMIFGSMQGLTVEGNYIHDFARKPNSGDHADMIQFSKNAQGQSSTDIVIRNNTLDVGSGDFTQMIFMGDGKASSSDPTYFYQNVLIEGNTIIGNHLHGITVGGADNVNILNNTLQYSFGGNSNTWAVPRVNVVGASTNVTIADNSSAGYVGYSSQSSWTLSNNTIVATDGSVTGMLADVSGSTSGSAITGSGATSSTTSGTTVSATTTSTTDTSGSATTSDTSGSTGNTATDPSASDPSASGSTDTSGSNTAATSTSQTDTAAADAGSSQTATASTTSTSTSGSSAGTTTLAPFDDYVLDVANAGTSGNGKLKGDAHVVNFGDHDAIVFDGYKDSVDLGRMQQFEQSDHLAYSIEYARAAADGSEQRLLWNHKKFGLAIEDDGLTVYVANNDRKMSKGFEIDNLGLNDTQTHEITVMMDQTADRLQVVVDDVVVLDNTSTDLDFVGNGGREWGWKLGVTRTDFIDGEISAFSVDDDFSFVDPTDPGIDGLFG